MDETRILLDGICEELSPYYGTPDLLRDELLENPPDAIAFTHEHSDHYDEKFAKKYETLTASPILKSGFAEPIKIGNLRLSTVITRHIGKVDVPHISFVIEGSKCVWFMGDASPVCLKNMQELPKPDVLIIPYAYAISDSAWRNTKEIGAKINIFLHLPQKDNDEYDLWKSVEVTTKKDESLLIPELGEVIEI